MSKNILSEKMLKEAAAKAIEIETSVYEKKIVRDKEHIFSDEYRRKIEKIKKSE